MFNSYTETTLRYDPDLCINCDMCSEVCPHGVFIRGAETAKLINPSACMECGACMINCPTRAIIVNSGVGCATAMMWAALRGKSLDEATCGVEIDAHGSKNTPDCCGGGSDCCG